MKKANLLLGVLLLALGAAVVWLALGPAHDVAPLPIAVDAASPPASPDSSVGDAEVSVVDPGKSRSAVSRGAASAAETKVAATAVVRDDRIAGTVLDHEGKPARAIVVLGSERVHSGEDGAFEFPAGADAGGARPRIVAFATGTQPAFVEPIGRMADGRSAWPQPLVLRLGETTRCIAGIVLRADGTPAPGIRVWARDLTAIGEMRDPSGDGGIAQVDLENAVCGRPAGWNPAVTDARGAFRLDGLMPRAYHLAAMGKGSVLLAEAEGVEAGREDVVLRFDESQLMREVRGHTVDRNGVPIADVRVRVTVESFRNGGSTWMDSGETTTTGADGAFVVHDLPRRGAYLRLDGDDVIKNEVGHDAPRWPFAENADVRVVMVRRCQFRVELQDPALADAFQILDAAGEPMSMTLLIGDGQSSTSTRFALANGASGTILASDAAATLVFLRGEQEIDRQVLGLIPGRTTVVRR